MPRLRWAQKMGAGGRGHQAAVPRCSRWRRVLENRRTYWPRSKTCGSTTTNVPARRSSRRLGSSTKARA